MNPSYLNAWPMSRPQPAHPARIRRLRLISFLLLSTVMALMAGACGKKGSPLPPFRERTPAVAELDGRMDENVLTLSWPLEPYRSSAYVRPAGFRVYRAMEKHGDTECPECPPRFQVAADISFDAVPGNDPRAVYTEKLETGYRYRFRVTPYLDDGAEAAPSDMLTIDP